MALFRKKDAAKRRARKDTHDLAMLQAKESYSFWGEERMAFDVYADLMITEGHTPASYYDVVKALKS